MRMALSAHHLSWDAGGLTRRGWKGQAGVGGMVGMEGSSASCACSPSPRPRSMPSAEAKRKRGCAWPRGAITAWVSEGPTRRGVAGTLTTPAGLDAPAGARTRATQGPQQLGAVPRVGGQLHKPGGLGRACHSYGAAGVAAWVLPRRD